MTTAWPVQDINGNKDDGVYEKNLLDKWISGYRQKGSLAELNSRINGARTQAEKSRVNRVLGEDELFLFQRPAFGHQV